MITIVVAAIKVANFDPYLSSLIADRTAPLYTITAAGIGTTSTTTWSADRLRLSSSTRFCGRVLISQKPQVKVDLSDTWKVKSRTCIKQLTSVAPPMLLMMSRADEKLVKTFVSV